VAGFLAGWVSLMVSSACCALELGVSGAIPLRIGLTAMLGYHALVGVFEGILTAGVLSLLFKVRPDLMKIDRLSRFGLADWIGAVVLVAIPAYILVMAGSSNLPDPLEKLLEAGSVPAGAGADSGMLSSAARYTGYMVKAAIFVLLIGFGFLAIHIGRRKRGRP
jgi:ABC-type Co2+ transport system permease subunit